MNVYRVEKDGVTFYVSPEKIAYYASEGYAVYKTVEEEVVNVEAEIADMESREGTAVIGGSNVSQV